MAGGRAFYVYILASKSGVIYVGMTGALARRLQGHKEKLFDGFTKKYNVTKLVWLERHDTARAAILREKEIKKWRREKKVALIEELNPEWADLSDRI